MEKNHEIINDNPEIITRTYYLKGTVIMKNILS